MSRNNTVLFFGVHQLVSCLSFSSLTVDWEKAAGKGCTKRLLKKAAQKGCNGSRIQLDLSGRYTESSSPNIVCVIFKLVPQIPLPLFFIYLYLAMSFYNFLSLPSLSLALSLFLSISLSLYLSHSFSLPFSLRRFTHHSAVRSPWHQTASLFLYW
eukprot:sb/3473195/